MKTKHKIRKDSLFTYKGEVVHKRAGMYWWQGRPFAKWRELKSIIKLCVI